MKALAVSQQQRSARVIDVPSPQLASPSMVRVRMLEVGVCGTDAELCAFEYGDPPAGADYLIAGHEALGIVEESGSDVEHLRAGDLVVPSVRRPCPHEECAPCASGHQDFCVTGDYTERGIKGAHGYLAEQVVEEERYLHIVPAELRDVGVLTEPLTIAEKGLRQYAAIQRRLPWMANADDEAFMQGHRAVVLGAGPVGLLGAMLFVERGFETWVFSRGDASTPNAKLATAFGATYVSSEDEDFRQLASEIGRVDLVYEATGAPGLAFDVMRHLDANAVCVLTGVPGEADAIRVEGDEIMKRLVLRNQVVVGTVNANRRDFGQAIRDLGRFDSAWPAELRGIITQRASMDKFCEHATTKHGIKSVIALPGSR
jgi:threonine dehydrogenase-like Zn-dependent dehydrogenase